MATEPESMRETYVAIATAVIRDLSVEAGAALIAQQIDIETERLRAEVVRLRGLAEQMSVALETCDNKVVGPGRVIADFDYNAVSIALRDFRRAYPKKGERAP